LLLSCGKFGSPPLAKNPEASSLEFDKVYDASTDKPRWSRRSVEMMNAWYRERALDSSRVMSLKKGFGRRLSGAALGAGWFASRADTRS
jgi:hypothetical protein